MKISVNNAAQLNLDSTINQATKYLQDKEQALFEIPVVNAIIHALVATGDGVQAVYAFEKENKFGQSIVLWGGDITKAIALPIASLAWLGLCIEYKAASKYVSDPAVQAKAKSKAKGVLTYLSPAKA